MNHRIVWIKTDKHVYGAIYREHQKNLTVFSAFSNPEPSELSMTPQMMTEWGFAGASMPLIKAETRWEHGRKAETTETEYFLVHPIEEDE